MCGICGKYSFNNQPATEDSIKGMCSVIKHRGPDDEGIYLDGPFGMGMRRLSIIDLDTGHQPMSNEDGSVWTVLNGEIYNYKELTNDLANKGHIFKTKSDTEVLVHLYEEYGYDFMKLLRGMFGFAIWDKKKQELLLARDPLGIKQLYYFKDNDRLIFGSEIKCILKAREETPKLNTKALYHYLTFMYFPQDYTVFENIVKIKPGHFLRIKNGSLDDTEYWNLNRFQEIKISFSESQHKLLELLRESMELHLRSDVPLGVFLSGGIDSSIITAIGAELLDKPLNTFTIGYGKEGDFYDEREFALMIAKRFKTNHHELTVSADVEDAISKLVYYFDEPFANSSAIPSFYISQMMQQHVKVALSGLGGDEVAGGYERYVGIKMLSRLGKLPKLIKRIAQYTSGIFADSKDGNYFADRYKRFTAALSLSPEQAYYSIISSASNKRKESVIANSIKAELKGLDSFKLFLEIFNSGQQDNILKSVMYFDIVSYTTNDLLVLSDRTSMANSLEVRVPFFDHKLVEFMFQLPVEYKIKGFSKKYILKKAFKGILPDEILFRKKRGFSTPLAVWLRSDLLKFAQSLFSQDRVEATEVLDYDGIQALFKEHVTRKANNQGIIFALMTFIIWHEMYIQNKISQREFIQSK